MAELVGITGSHGHIGGSLLKKLTFTGANVVALDRSGNIPGNIQTVFDTAAYGNKYDQTDEDEIFKANVDRVIRLLKNSEDKKSIILTSSSSVLLPVQTRYSKSKSDMERIVNVWFKMTGANVVIVRPSTVVGVGEDTNHLIPKLIHSAFTGEPMDFVGGPTHDYIDVDDVVDAMIYLSNKAKSLKGQVFNVSFGVSIPNELVKDIVAEEVGKQPNVRRVKSLRNYDTTKWLVPSDKLRALGWRPKKNLFVSIKEMVADYKLQHELT